MNLWLENVAKFEIGHYLENLLESFPDKKIKVLDIGAGTGGDWILLIEKYSNLELHLWEPFQDSKIVLDNKFNNVSVVIHHSLDDIEDKFDYLISLSVLEHVKRLDLHCRSIKRLLKFNGTYICNFDDGHFRYMSNNIWSFSANKLAMSETARTLISKYFGVLYSVGKFQKKVDLQTLIIELNKVNLELVDIDFRNISALKNVCKFLQNTDQQHEYAEMWLNFEKYINIILLDKPTLREKVFASRTAYIKHIN